MDWIIVIIRIDIRRKLDLGALVIPIFDLI